MNLSSGSIEYIHRPVNQQYGLLYAKIHADIHADYWTWSSPTLNALDFSLVIRGGIDGFSCYVRGNNQIWLPTSLASGYTDGKSSLF